jgi:hypothetical protein
MSSNPSFEITNKQADNRTMPAAGILVFTKQGIHMDRFVPRLDQ